MALTRSEKEFIEFIKTKSQDAKPDNAFSTELVDRIQNTWVDAKGNDKSIRWNHKIFTASIMENIEHYSTEMISEICNQLLDQNTFDGEAPLRQPHLFSYLYMELLRRFTDSLDLDNPQLATNLRELNHKMLVMNVFMQRDAKGITMTKDVVPFFISTACTVNVRATQKMFQAKDTLLNIINADLETYNKDALLAEAAQKREELSQKRAELLINRRMSQFSQKPNSPIPQRKQRPQEEVKAVTEPEAKPVTEPEVKAVTEPEVKAVTEPEAKKPVTNPLPQSPHLSALRKQYEDRQQNKPQRSTSTSGMFAERSKPKQPTTSKSDGAVKDKKPTKGSSNSF